ncbi:MAG: tetratricopeptide repeat protein [Deltaproteobacteria bacterium]|nr:tetratricopeptide repeat protein [Deltaproteobacteria bacterium]
MDQFPRDAEIVKGMIDLPRRDVAILLETGYLLMEFTKLKEAEEVFHGVSALLPHSEVPHVALGNLFFSQGKFQNALKEHKRAHELRPEAALPHAHIGECLYALHRFDEGTAELKQALQKEPDGATADFAKNLLEARDLGIFDAMGAK